MKNYGQAIEIYEKAISDGHGHANLYHNLGEAYKLSGNMDKANENYQKGYRFARENSQKLQPHQNSGCMGLAAGIAVVCMVGWFVFMWGVFG